MFHTVITIPRFQKAKILYDTYKTKYKPLGHFYVDLKTPLKTSTLVNMALTRSI